MHPTSLRLKTMYDNGTDLNREASNSESLNADPESRLLVQLDADPELG
jgi:hypothetical protein